MKTLYFDCFSGAAGDMILGALIEAGVPLDDVRDALGDIAVERDLVWTEPVMRAGIRATKLCVRGEAAKLHGYDAEITAAAAAAHRHEHHHEHAGHHGHTHVHVHTREPEDHAHPPHRTLAEIRTIIERSGLSTVGKERAIHLFRRLGEAEAAVHGTSMNEVHLHEVGAFDSIVDILGSVYALEALGAENVLSSPLNVGGGMVRSAHGRYPVPAPATTRLLRGAPIYAGQQQVELVTPTGALLVTDYARGFGPVPPMRLGAVGYGAGTRDLPGTPNVLRVLVGEADPAAAASQVVVIEADIDDMSPQLFGPLMESLLAQGALDVFLAAIQMKKNRPGTLLTVLAPPALRERLCATIFRETTTIGIRYREVSRECLDRQTVLVATPYGDVRVKVATRNGEQLNVAPEFDDCVALARATGHAVKDVQAAAMKAFLDRSSSTTS